MQRGWPLEFSSILQQRIQGFDLWGSVCFRTPFPRILLIFSGWWMPKVWPIFVRLVQQARRKVLVLHFSVMPAALVSSKMSALVGMPHRMVIGSQCHWYLLKRTEQKKNTNQNNKKETKQRYNKTQSQNKKHSNDTANNTNSKRTKYKTCLYNYWQSKKKKKHTITNKIYITHTENKKQHKEKTKQIIRENVQLYVLHTVYVYVYIRT